MIPSELLQQIRWEANEPAPEFWSDAEIYRYMSNAEFLLSHLLNCNETLYTMPSVANQAAYNLPVDSSGAQYITNILRVEWNTFELLRKNKNEIDRLIGSAYNYQYPSGNPIYYFHFGNIITIYPTPSIVANIVIYYNKVPATLKPTSQIFTIPVQFHHLLADYCLYKMFSKENMNDEAALHIKLWENNIQKAREEWTKRNQSGAFATVRLAENYTNNNINYLYY
jgi:hypothetical protein